MKVDAVYSWTGGSVPERFKGEGPFEITMEDIVELSRSYDVAIMHFQQEQPTWKEQRAGAPAVPDHIGICLDIRYGKFRQR